MHCALNGFRLLKARGVARHPLNMTMINTIVKTTDLESFAVYLNKPGLFLDGIF